MTRLETPADLEVAAVVGAGEMGRGIAAVQALAGREVRLFDVDEEQLSNAMEHVEWSIGKAAEKGRVDEGEQEVEVKLPGKYLATPQIAGALRAVPGVEWVEIS